MSVFFVDLYQIILDFFVIYFYFSTFKWFLSFFKSNSFYLSSGKYREFFHSFYLICTLYFTVTFQQKSNFHNLLFYQSRNVLSISILGRLIFHLSFRQKEMQRKKLENYFDSRFSFFGVLCYVLRVACVFRQQPSLTKKPRFTCKNP